MPKRVFWPATLVIMGLIFLASNLGYLPFIFWNLWPVIFIVVGLGGLITSDREEWVARTRSTAKPSAKPMAKSRATSKKSR